MAEKLEDSIISIQDDARSTDTGVERVKLRRAPAHPEKNELVRASTELSWAPAHPEEAPAHPTKLNFGAPAHPMELSFGAPAHPTKLNLGAPAHPTELSFGAPAHPTKLSFGAPAHPTELRFGVPAHPTKLNFIGAPAHPTKLNFIGLDGAPAHPTKLNFIGAPAHPTKLGSGAPAHPTKLGNGAPAHPTKLENGAPAHPTKLSVGAPAHPTELSVGAPAHPTELSTLSTQGKILNPTLSMEDLIINDWEDAIGQQPGATVDSKRIRRIEKVPQTLRGLMNDNEKIKEYDPVLVSFGPYHHGKKDLRLAEEFKHTSLRIYALRCHGKCIEGLRNKVYEVIGELRACYAEDSTNEYNDDEKFAEMMLLDGCLLLNVIEFATGSERRMLLLYEHLGALGFSHVCRDMFLLENQLPFKLLQVLISIKYDQEDQRNKIFDILDKFFDFVSYGDSVRGKKFTETIGQYKMQPPLHLLEIYRACFLVQAGMSNSNKKLKSVDDDKTDFKKYAYSFRSVTEMKAKGILFRPCNSSGGGKSGGADLNFKSHCLYGELEIPPMIIDQDSKSALLNLIAYEMCPNNPNDFRVTSYVQFMKMLIQHVDDVKELRTKNILLNFMNRDDEEVATMFKDIITPPDMNIFALDMIKKEIQNHYDSKVTNWFAELITKYFNSPWTAIAWLAAAAALVLTIVQTHFSIHPRK